MEVDYTEVFKEIEAISASLRFSIKHMPRYYRYVLGDRILNILLDIKLMVKLKCKGRNLYSRDFFLFKRKRYSAWSREISFSN